MIYLTLLRGINVGGKTMVKMSGLKTCFEQLGFEHVTTYINSGNVIFGSPETDPRKLEKTIEAALLKAFAHPIKIVVRSQAEIMQVIHNIPKDWLNNLDKKCNVVFLRHTIDNPSILEDLHPKAGIEELIYKPGVLYWAAQTSDLTKSEMIKLSRNSLYQEMTIRNLNTTQKIYKLMRAKI